MTAVEWLIDKHFGGIDNVTPDFKHHIEQAKEIEKEQLECAWNSSDRNMRFQFSSSAYKGITFEQWLENFKEE